MNVIILKLLKISLLFFVRLENYLFKKRFNYKYLKKFAISGFHKMEKISFVLVNISDFFPLNQFQNNNFLSYHEIVPLQAGNHKISLSETAIEGIKSSRNTMEEASKQGFSKLDQANRGFLKSTEKMDKKQQQISLLRSLLNGTGKGLKPEQIRFIFQKILKECLKIFKKINLSLQNH